MAGREPWNENVHHHRPGVAKSTGRLIASIVSAALVRNWTAARGRPCATRTAANGSRNAGWEELRGSPEANQCPSGRIAIALEHRETDDSRRDREQIQIVEDEEKNRHAGDPAQRIRRASTNQRPSNDEGKASRDDGTDQEEAKWAAHERHHVHRDADDHWVFDDAVEVGHSPGTNAAQPEQVWHVGESVRMAIGCVRGELKDQRGSEQAAHDEHRP